MNDQSASAVSSGQEEIRNLLQPLQVGFLVQHEMALSLVLKLYTENLFTVPQMLLGPMIQ